ncbi:hemolysin family protein [Sedimentisphaera salicampi]|uniref:Magnesium and cobalt efflux protein CorC n=1 Tax=Sedimentisphaera salicampi TaxID=1941349 RepID=A0A1W6LN29_9BACT|nr:hemolysin family protein [Sedimentisphaera salicampi]ARN57143.1 Magnesium and cobalt efflux protein CorC [Sedimentisphaera salicampi]OXU14786.1 Magnesium and cobalt efflux protein CorC [Sedimentisphaera salicampi]
MEEIGWLAVITAVSAVGSCLFSASSLSFKSFSRRRLLETSKNKDKAEELARNVSENSEKLSMTARFFQLLFNAAAMLTIVRFFVVGENNFLTEAELFYAFLISLVLVCTFSIVIPRPLSVYVPERVIRLMYAPVLLLSQIIKPVIYIFRLNDIVVMRLSGVQHSTEEEQIEEKHDEILDVVEKSVDEGVVDNEEMAMIENILELDETNAIEIITPRTDLVAIEVSTNFEDVVKIIRGAGHSRVPVYENKIDNIVGLVYAKDLLSEFDKNTEDFNLREKVREAYFVPETITLRELLHEFQKKKQHLAVVLDEYGGVAGIVTIEDVLEELVGEIEDEYERKAPASIKPVNENLVELDAQIYVDDLNQNFDIELPEDEDYDTVGGFVFSHLGYIPKPGETFTYRNLLFTVLAAEKRKIKRLRIEKKAEAEAV